MANPSITIRLPADVLEAIKQKAEELEKPKTAYISELVQDRFQIIQNNEAADSRCSFPEDIESDAEESVEVESPSPKRTPWWRSWRRGKRGV